MIRLVVLFETIDAVSDVTKTKQTSLVSSPKNFWYYYSSTNFFLNNFSRSVRTLVLATQKSKKSILIMSKKAIIAKISC